MNFTPFLKMIDSDWTPYSSREEWADVKPIPQFENGAPIAPIDYSEQFDQTMSYFRAICKSEEYSERAL